MPTLCSDAPGCPQVSTLCGQQASVPVHWSPLWVSDFSTRVHQAAAARRQQQVVKLHVYLDDHQTTISVLQFSAGSSTTRSQTLFQVGTFPVHRDAVQHSTIHSGAPTEDALQGPVRSSALDYRPEHHSQGSALAFRHVGVHGFAGTTEKTSPYVRSSGGPPQHGARGPGAGPTRSKFLSGFCQRWPGEHLQQSCKVYPSPPRRRKWLSSRMRPVRAGKPS